MRKLFEPYEALQLQNRLVMAPMTRCMATNSHVPTESMKEYYARRVGLGLIVTEATMISEEATGYPNTPGIFTLEQAKGWKNIVYSVQSQGTKVFCQLFHAGRVSHPHFLKGKAPIAPSAIALEGKIPRSPGLSYGVPRSLETQEIKALVQEHLQAARYALEVAGFDGIELHGANGYLLQQFLHEDTNQRIDEYGGSKENKVRFILECVDAIIQEFGSRKVAMRLTLHPKTGIKAHEKDLEVMPFLLKELEKRDIAYVHISSDFLDTDLPTFQSHFQGTLIGSGGLTPLIANQLIEEAKLSLVSFGRPLIANPNFVEKIQRGIELIPYSPEMLSRLH